MKAIFHHFIFRISQCFRIFSFQGKTALPFLIIAGVLIALKLPDNRLYPLLFFLIALSFHFRRKDIPFLKKAFIKNWRIIIFLESTFIYLFLLLGNIHHKYDIIGFAGLLLITSFSFFYPKTKISVTSKWDFIPNELFEWKCLLRKNTVAAIIIYLVVIASAYHISTLIFCGLFVLDLFPRLYSNNENKEMLEMYFRKYTLEDKIRKNMKLFNLVFLSVYIVFLILNRENSLLLLYYILFMNLFLILALTRKYKVYHYKERSNYFDMGIYLSYFIYTITIIPAIVIIVDNIKSAKENISQYVGN
ncbi:hypothetical protein OZ664_06360 [Elizabethkingia sp. HX WHF]|uniref:hypothetical protein n=1 Tax=Elizabethkingia TaxID=308865 RepID=UPI00099A2546|nr:MULTISPECIES: hypothetical protein [Elizabethkingia]ATL42604.1 hypothetical protein CQS02_04425 [Elizabethkingia miricola]MCL1637148.1 hypothetical protein [Elizabethkingia bruuniana]MDX8563617.1 hypothetical protein [Elizabethkingia sp. HX WHF]OPC20067.1 hypothetical protein BAY00_11270 [Elizabethkingia bruuniana]